ncbi:MAG: hypothetical protein M3518_06880 [Actinomycetota bacterium]|nr:hypothetical protein [Actinomycetota bacterium]
MSEKARARSAPARNVALILGFLLVAAVGAAALAGVAVQAQALGAAPAELTEEELLSRITAGPESTPDFSATVNVEQTIVPEGLLGASQGNGAGSSGPRSARIWHGGQDQFRAELLGQNGDQIFVKNGSEISAYDGATNTLRTGQKPEAAEEQRPERAASPEEINEVLAEISPTSDLKTGPPVQVADRWAYPLTLEPKDKSLTLIERADAFVDAEAFVPLSFELYAENNPEPVIRYEASDFQVGDVPDERFQFETPPGATVEAMEKPGNDEEQGEEGREYREPQQVASVEEAQQIVGFPVGQLNAPGGRELAEVRVAGSEGVIQTYGTGWGTVTLVQKPESAEEVQEVESQEEDSGRQGHGQQFEVPTVDLGGVEAKEISTPIGTALSWNVNGVSYHLVGSAPAAELEEAARGLLR